MLWDCEYCSHPKLLGVTHRHCPNCGAAQNPAKRYFPPDHEKVAVEDHKFVGADVHCPACREPQSGAANNCGNCGSPLKGGQAAFVHAAPPGPKPKSYAWVFYLVGAIVLGIVSIFVVRACWKKEAVMAVTSHSWKRSIEVERYDKTRESGDCSSVPSGAKILDRKKGEKKCTTKKVDQGDGTFKEKTECTEPAEQCSYEILKWRTVRTLEEKGAGVDGPMKWPDVRLGRTGTCEGCEREGRRTESYIVELKETPGGETHTCSFDSPDKWKSYQDGGEYKGKIRVVGGDLDCDSLAAK
jgi:hypothetical protein